MSRMQQDDEKRLVSIDSLSVTWLSKHEAVTSRHMSRF